MTQSVNEVSKQSVIVQSYCDVKGQMQTSRLNVTFVRVAMLVPV